MNYGDQVIEDPKAVLREELEVLRAQTRNDTIDELCTWLHSCIEHVDHDSEVFKACTAMVNAMQGKKTPVTAALGNRGGHFIRGNGLGHFGSRDSLPAISPAGLKDF